jgi:hypothetical protein
MLSYNSLVGGQFATYETLSSWGYLFAAGLGNAEHTITVNNPRESLILTNTNQSEQAYPGACLADLQCYGGSAHGMVCAPK